jgi:hypothetical protein
MSECFFPFISLVYSAPRTSSLLSACKSTSLIASTTVCLLSVVNWTSLTLDLLWERLPI